MPPVNFQNLIGKTFERLTVISRAPNGKGWKVRWNCECICGNTVAVAAGRLKSGDTKSCGCLQKEILIKRITTHGMSKSPEYDTWNHMKDRCHNPKNPKFKIYGARGITVCNEWRYDFTAFYNHVGKRPSSKHSIDRIDNDGNYQPGNVRWADKKTQNNNSRHNHYITINNVTKTATQWSEISGISPSAICRRLYRKWPPRKAIYYSAVITIHGWSLSLVEWARFTGINRKTISERLKHGWPLAKAMFQPVKHHKPYSKKN